MPTDSGGPITPDTIDKIYRDLIQPMLLDGSSGVEPAPTLVLLGAQPGSGKSRASARLLSEHDGMIALSGDDLRIFHPDYRTLITDRPQEAGAVLAEATRTWVRRTIKDALDQRRSLLLEGTFGDPDVTLATAARFRDSGFQVRIVAIASPRVLSVVTAASRYLRDRKVGSPARFTSLSAHDRGYDGTTRLVDSVDAGTLADGVTVLSRNGATLFDRVRDAGTPAPFAGARTALYEGRHPASWGARSTMELLGELKQITNFAISDGHLMPDTTDLLIEAHALALAQVVPLLSIDPDSEQARFIHQAVSEQSIALRRVATPADTVDTQAAPQLAPRPSRGLSAAD